MSVRNKALVVPVPVPVKALTRPSMEAVLAAGLKKMVLATPRALVPAPIGGLYKIQADGGDALERAIELKFNNNPSLLTGLDTRPFELYTQLLQAKNLVPDIKMQARQVYVHLLQIYLRELETYVSTHVMAKNADRFVLEWHGSIGGNGTDQVMADHLLRFFKMPWKPEEQAPFLAIYKFIAETLIKQFDAGKNLLRLDAAILKVEQEQLQERDAAARTLLGFSTRSFLPPSPEL